jgi:uncharacterized protein
LPNSSADRDRAQPWLRSDADGSITLAIHVQPGAKRTEVAGVHGDALKVRIASAPVEGKANDALIAFLAEAYGVAKRAVTLVRGETSRRKIVRITAAARRPDRDWSR